MLPKAVLRPAPRGGARRRHQAAQFVLRRCARWLEGEREALWDDNGRARQSRPRSAADSEEGQAAELARRHARCKALAAEGELSRACSALVDPPPLDGAQGVPDSLRSKHPQAHPARPNLQSLGPAPSHAVPDISQEQVVTAARSFRTGSAPGPTGLRADHIRQALNSAHGDEVAAHMTEFVRFLAAGNAPLEVAPHLAGATLHALPKPGGDLRPIAVGEVWRRLVSKCLCRALQEEFRTTLWPLQVGVAVPSGAEAAVHTAR